MQGSPAKHRLLARSPSKLDERGGVLDLPLLVDSLPIVGPVLSPLLDDGSGGSAQSSTPSSPPAPSSTAGNGSGSGGGNNGNGNSNGNGNGNGNGGGGNGNGNGGGNGNDNGNGGGGNGNGNGNGNSNGNGNGNGKGSAPTPTSPPSGGGSTGVPSPSVVVPRPSSSSSSQGKSPSSPNPNDSGSSGVQSPGSNGGSSGIQSSSAGKGQTVPINVGTVSAASGTLVPAALATGFVPPSESSGGSGSQIVGTAASSTAIASDDAASSHQHLSGGAIAGIVIVCLFFLFAFVLLYLRRRAIARRLELRRQWWFSRNPSSGSFSFVSPSGSDGGSPPSRQSARSSFATNFDQGLMFRADSPRIFSLSGFPGMPPMAQVGERNSALISTGGAVARRESMNSMLSDGSDADVQYLTHSTDQLAREPSASMCVRPFSPSESFAFPKPPVSSSSTMDCFAVGIQNSQSFHSSAATLVQLSLPPPVLMTDLPPPLSKVPFHPQALTPTAVPVQPDPFADMMKPEFASIEIIRRPFVPSLEDELSVHPCDRVRVLRLFDDGWALVEKLALTDGGRHERGLIPIDCLREAGQTLPAFIAQKRIQSFGSDQLTPVAV